MSRQLAPHWASASSSRSSHPTITVPPLCFSDVWWIFAAVGVLAAVVHPMTPKPHGTSPHSAGPGEAMTEPGDVVDVPANVAGRLSGQSSDSA